MGDYLSIQLKHAASTQCIKDYNDFGIRLVESAKRDPNGNKTKNKGKLMECKDTQNL